MSAPAKALAFPGIVYTSHVASEIRIPIRLALWIDPEQLDLLRPVVHRLGALVSAVGTPVVGRAPELAAALGPGTRPIGDLRAMLPTLEAEVLLCTTSAGVGQEIVDAARGTSLKLLCFEPFPSSVLEVQSGLLGDDQADAGVAIGPEPPDAQPIPSSELSITHIGLMRHGRTMRSAADVLSHIGCIHTVTAHSLAGPGQGSLGARLFDAIDLVSSLLGEPEGVSASFVWPGRGAKPSAVASAPAGRAVHMAPNESLRGLHGLVAACFRYPDGRAATILAGDATAGCGRWARRATIIGDQGRLEIDDQRFEFFPADGRASDRSRVMLEGLDAADLDPLALAVFCDDLAAAMDPHAPPRPPIEHVRILSIAGAAMLSARTGENESPATLLRMARAG